MSAVTPFFRESGEGEAVVCLHASASSSGQWRALMERLGKRYRSIAPDLVGYGRSPAWQGESDLWLNDEVDSLAPVFDAAGQRFSLIGHSYGGAVALKAALRYRKRLRCLIVYEPVLVSLLLTQAPDHPAAAEITTLRDETIRAVEQDALATAADVGQGPMEMFGQTIEIQPGHPGVEEPHYMLHIYFKPGGKVLFGTNPETAFDPEGVCPEASASATSSASAMASATASATASSSASALAATGGAFSLTSLAALASMVLLAGTGVLAFGVIRRS